MQLFTKLVIATTFATQLTGCFPAVVGGAAVGGTIVADRRTAGIFVEDQNIELKAVKKMITNLGEQSHVNVTSFNLNVLLTGEVPDEARKTLAENLLKEIPNISSVTNQLVIAPESSLASRSNDTLITTTVKKRFVIENRFPANYVKVVTEDSVVYLMGIVTQDEAEAAAEIARNTSGVSRVVKVFEYKQ